MGEGWLQKEVDKRKKEGEEHSEENKWKEETLPGQEQDGKEIVQLIFQVWKQFQPLFIYFFIYNLERDDFFSVMFRCFSISLKINLFILPSSYTFFFP